MSSFLKSQWFLASFRNPDELPSSGEAMQIKKKVCTAQTPKTAVFRGKVTHTCESFGTVVGKSGFFYTPLIPGSMCIFGNLLTLSGWLISCNFAQTFLFPIGLFSRWLISCYFPQTLVFPIGLRSDRKYKRLRKVAGNQSTRKHGAVQTKMCWQNDRGCLANSLRFSGFSSRVSGWRIPKNVGFLHLFYIQMSSSNISWRFFLKKSWHRLGAKSCLTFRILDIYMWNFWNGTLVFSGHFRVDATIFSFDPAEIIKEI